METTLQTLLNYANKMTLAAGKTRDKMEELGYKDEAFIYQGRLNAYQNMADIFKNLIADEADR